MFVYLCVYVPGIYHVFFQAAPVAVILKKQESGVLMVMNLPDSLTEDHVRELLSPFGELKRFNLLKVI